MDLAKLPALPAPENAATSTHVALAVRRSSTVVHLRRQGPSTMHPDAALRRARAALTPYAPPPDHRRRPRPAGRPPRREGSPVHRSLGLLTAAAALTIAAPVSTAQAATASGSGAAVVGTARENTVVRLINARRAKKGCRALKHHPRLHKAARGHAADMAEHEYFSDTSRDGRSFTDRVKRAGFTGGTSLAENIATGRLTPAAVVRAWMGASTTKDSLMNCGFTFIGVGAADDSGGATYWTAVFAAR
ncbi:CAP domain-containing protein [Nonomuraea wenchangensis]|uniref:CAP domain-containing protein n=1 Tax=Nonomuraea wenchangensis TaxID=568860 RepID=UPI0033EBB8E0